MNFISKLFAFKSLRTRITLTFMLIVVIIGIISVYLGIRFIGDGIINQAQGRVRADLNSASEIVKLSEEKIQNVAKFTANRFFIKNMFVNDHRKMILRELQKIELSENLDFIGVTDAQGRVLLRTNIPDKYGDDISSNSVIHHCLQNKFPVVSTELLTEEELRRENSNMADRARVQIIPTPKAKFQREGEETVGMVIMAAACINDDDNNVLGVLYCGRLINNNFEHVDKIKNTIYLGEEYKGRDIGTATIFMKDLRISTNVMNRNGERAIGTLVSKEVYEAVIEQGQFWIDRAFVVNDWYITSYKPMRNIKNEIIGILYVGILERKYTDLRDQIIILFASITLLSMIAVFGFSYILANNITRPLRDIASASKKIAQGYFPPEIEIQTNDEISDLGKAFQYMISALKARDEELKESVRKTVAETERLAMVGQLAAGVAHEVNNPLTGILLYCDLVLKAIPEDSPQRKNIEKINKEAKRCKIIIRGLLDFARPRKPEIKESSINKIIESTVTLVKNQATFLDIEIVQDLMPDLPFIKVDPDQIRQVFMNITINAAEAMNGKGKLTIRSYLSEEGKFILVSYSDTGPGIKQEQIDKIFEPFFTTKEVTHGVGLGLAISHRIIQNHNGSIKVASESGKGATFTITLPTPD